MRAGDKKWRIRLETLSTEKSTFGSDVETWILQKELWSAVQYVNGQERANADGVESEATVIFKIDYIAALSPKLHRIRFNNIIYGIEFISVLGYREALQIACKALAIDGVGEGVAGSVQRVIPQTIAQLTRQGNVSIATPQNTGALPIVLQSYAEYNMTIVGINNLRTASGSITVGIYINGIAVTGLSNLSATTTAQNPTATGGNAVSVGDRITMELSNNATAAGLEFTMKISV